MPNAIVHLGQLELSFSLPRAAIGVTADPLEDWRDCQVKVRIHSYTGAFVWSLMPTELSHLADDLSELYSRFPRAGSVNFESAEPNVALSFTIGQRGEVRVQFRLMDTFDDPVTLEGSFESDQHMLLEAANNLRRLVQEENGDSGASLP